MINKLNKKGFTLVELLAVLVILAAIMGIAIPSITSSMERNKEKQNESKERMLESFAEIYVADHKNALYNNLGTAEECYISVTELRDKGYLTDDADKYSDNSEIKGCVIFNKKNHKYTFKKDEYNCSSIGASPSVCQID